MEHSSRPALLTSEKEWDTKWAQIFDQYQHDLRHAYYIRSLINRHEKKILEIAAGSFRDMARLCKWGIDCEGVDFSSESVNRAKEKFPQIKDKIHQMDAFNFKYENKYFDLTYHNGFWILFNDNDIELLAKEQARISKYRMITTVHNAHNKSFKSYFDKKAIDDPLFHIRFFEVDEIREIMLKVCSEVSIIPVGKAKKKFEDYLINKGLGYPWVLRSCFDLCGYSYLNESERLLCIGKI